MKVKIKGIITDVIQSKKNSNQYVGLFDTETATQYQLVSKTTDFMGVPKAVPVEIDAIVAPRQFPGSDGRPSTVLYVDQASVKAS